MKSLQRVAFIGNHLPRRCGIATFTHDLHAAVVSTRPDIESTVVAMTDTGRSYEYPSVIGREVSVDTIADYARAAEWLNSEGYDVVSLQHEYGIFGGAAGGHILELLARLRMPVVTTLHTILPEPSLVQRDVMGQIIDASARLVVMSKKGREILGSVYHVPARKIDLIPHGIPEVPYREPDQAKAKFGFDGKTVILTFGLLSPSKGIEVMLDAMPGIIEACPSAQYVILGATHPNLVRDQGEAYRDSLIARVQALGIGDHVLFVDRFVDQATLLDYISACDVYVTPYLNEAQMTSGTLAYSFGLGRAVVSTPYWHARELLAGGRGILVPFGDAQAMSTEIAGLLTNPARRRSMCKRAYNSSRPMTWARTAERYLASFGAARPGERSIEVRSAAQAVARKRVPNIPELRLGHLLAMCDSTGMLQHALHSVPDRSHGYCVDDNARALMLLNALARTGDTRVSTTLTARLAAFVQHAWNPGTGRFRNFMSYDRRWLEDTGSEDSHGRTLWALGECARDDVDQSRRRWAASLFKTALPVVETFTSPRAWAFCLLGLDAYLPQSVADLSARRLRAILANRLMDMLKSSASSDWHWFEDLLAYDNARLSQALIQTGLATGTPAYVKGGLRSLRWLMTRQTAPSGCFRPVGTASFGRRWADPEAFDQQPVEAAATISACLAAARADTGAEWPALAMNAFRWFLGDNDLRIVLIDPDTGGCADGLHPDRRNENMGAESALSYLLGLVEIRSFAHATLTSMSTDRSDTASIVLRRAEQRPQAGSKTMGNHLATLPLPEPSDLASASRSGTRGRPPVQARDRAARSQPDR